MDFKNNLKGAPLPSQYNCFDRIEKNEYGAIPLSENKLSTASMGDKPMPYRYHPPLQFQPATPPTKSRCSTNIFGTSEQFIRRPVCPNRTQKDGDTSGNTTVIDCSQPQVRLSWRKQMEKPPVPRNNDSVCKTDLPVTNHTRQRSMPVTMPSFEKTSLIPSSGLLSVDTESVNLSRTSSTGNVKSNTLLGPNGSYNVVIDIKLRGPESISFTNRMTQSFIEDGGQRIQFRDGLIGRQRSTGELSHHLLEDVHHLSLDNRSRTVQDNCRPKNNFLPRNQSSDSNVSHKPSVCLDNTDDSTTPSLDVSSEPIEFEDVTNPDKTSLNCCKPYNPKTPIPNRRRESSALEEQTKVKISWSPTRAERSNSTSMLRTDRYPNWTRPKMVNFSTNPDVPQLIRLLQSPDTDTVANASAYLQHLVYKNPGLKDKTRQCGGIAALVQLLYSDHAQICLNTVGVLRNLTSGDNLEIKDELERVGGIRALAWLIENRQSHLCEAAHRRQSSGSPEGTPTFFSMNETNTDAFRPSLENAAAVLCNLAGVDHLKRSVLHEALLPSLINTVIRPVATVTANQETGWNSSTTRVPYNQLLFRNTVAVVRNVSSMDSAEYREQLRQCPWLLWSLLTVVRASVTQHCMDLKSVEHCACSLRNLSYALHNLSVLDEPSANKPEEPTVKSKSAIPRLRLRGQQSKRSSIAEGSPIGQSYQYPSDNPVGLFFNYQTIQVVLDLLQHSSNPCTLEAAAGILQNLTAGNWAPAQLAKQTIRSHHGLPILTELLNAPSPRVILVISNALRNLATEDHCCLLLGKHALERVILTLTKCANNLTEMGNVRRVENPEWQMPNQEYQTNQSARSSVYGGLSDHVSIKLVYSVTSAVLHLCAVLVQRRIEHAKRFTTLGGIEKCREIYLTTKHQSSIRGAGDMDESKEAAGDARARAFQISEQLLHILWNFTELRPIYKLAGWTESDFGITKRGSRLGSLVRRKSKTVTSIETPKSSMNGQSRLPARRSDSLSLIGSAASTSDWPIRTRYNVPLNVRDLRTQRAILSRTSPADSNRFCHAPPGSRSNTLPADLFDGSTSDSTTHSSWLNRRWTTASRPEAVYVPTSNIYHPASMELGSSELNTMSNFTEYDTRTPVFNSTSNHLLWTGKGRNKLEHPGTPNGDVPDSWV